MPRTNTVKKKKVFKPYKNLGDLYTEAVHGEPRISLQAFRGVTEETATIVEASFDNTDVMQHTAWSDLAGKYYNSAKDYGKSNTGPGEMSAGITLVQTSRPDIKDDEETIIRVIKQSVLRHKGGASVDIHNPFTKKYYEVKQASDRKSVLVGAHAKETATDLHRKIRDGFLALYRSYRLLNATHKQILNNAFPVAPGQAKVQTLEEIFNYGAEYFTKGGSGNSGELSRGCVLPVSRTHAHIPQLYRLPLYLIPEILNNQNYIVGAEDTDFATEFYKLQYKVDDSDAIAIDNLVKDYIRRKQQLSEQAEADVDKQAFSDFLSIARESPVFGPGKFKSEVQAYFEPGTERSRETLMKIFPYDGIFVVDPTGYLYAGKSALHTLLRIDCISNGTLKVLPKTAITADTPANIGTQ